MRRFTESPYEELMGQVPEGAHPAPSPGPPPGDRCRGCPYGKPRPCIGVCMKELAKKQRGREQEMKGRSVTYGKESGKD